MREQQVLVLWTRRLHHRDPLLVLPVWSEAHVAEKWNPGRAEHPPDAREKDRV